MSSSLKVGDDDVDADEDIAVVALGRLLEGGVGGSGDDIVPWHQTPRKDHEQALLRRKRIYERDGQCYGRRSLSRGSEATIFDALGRWMRQTPTGRQASRWPQEPTARRGGIGPSIIVCAIH
jgi:hypothetical protein